MDVYVLTCLYHDNNYADILCVEVYSTIEEARAELKEQYEARSEGEPDCVYCKDYAEVANCYNNYRWQWNITESEVE